MVRSDAARSRSRIIDVARECDLSTLRLNDVAKQAGVGVGTVYRHFPTVHALVEALTAETVDELLAISNRASQEQDPARAFEGYLRAALDLQLSDSGLQTVLMSRDDATEPVREAKRQIFESFAAVLVRAQDEGAVRTDVTLEQISHLVCGVEHAVRLGSPTDRDLLLGVLIAGLRP